MTIVPDYYKEFKCLASECSHNCCIGWEIDIDNETAARYRKIADEEPAGRPLKDCLEKYTDVNEDGTIHFVLSDNERCPYLRKDGLCELICTYGEEILCNICADHPRFRNFKKDHVEMGIGMACEEAARLIISHEGPVKYEELETGREALPDYLKAKKRKAVELIPDGEIDWDYFADFFLSLERLDEEWTGLITLLLEESETPHQKVFRSREWKERFERIKEYLMYRHCKADDRDFVELCWNLIIKLMDVLYAKKKNAEAADLINVARLFSAEIEYSDENVEIIKDELMA